jgi:hypothetical protein
VNVLGKLMARKPKTPAHITEDEKELIYRIIAVCSGKIYHFLKTHSDPKKYASMLPKLWSSQKTLFLPNLLFATMSMSTNELIFPDDLKMKVAKAINHDEEDVTGAILDLKKRQSTYLKSWAATEAFQDLVNEGLLSNISGKRIIKKIAPAQNLKKGRGYSDIKREGLYSAYMITGDLGALNKVISKHETLKIIHQKLIKYGKLEEFFLFNGLASVYAMMKSDDNVYKFFNVAAQAFLDNSPTVQAALSRAGVNSKEIQYSLWEPIKNYLSSIKKEELERFVRKMIRPLVKNPIDYRYTLLAISQS